MAVVGLNEAARLVGRAKTTLLRHVSKGKLSATVDADGHKRFDTAELARVYGWIDTGATSSETATALPVATSRAKPPSRGAKRRSDAPDAGAVVDALERQVARLEADLVRLRADFEKERDERQQWADRYRELAERTLQRLPGPTTPTESPQASSSPPIASMARWLAAEVREFGRMFRP